MTRVRATGCRKENKMKVTYHYKFKYKTAEDAEAIIGATVGGKIVGFGTGNVYIESDCKLAFIDDAKHLLVSESESVKQQQENKMNITINIDVLRGIVLSTTKNGVETNAIIDRVLAISNLDAAQSGVVSFPANPKEGDTHELYSNVHPEFTDNIFTTLNSQQDEVWICFPNSLAGATGGRCNEALIWNYRHNTWTKRDLPNILERPVHPDRVHKAHKQAINKDAEWRDRIEKRVSALEEGEIIPAGTRYMSDFGFLVVVTSDTPERELNKAAADAFKEGRTLDKYPERN